MTDPQKRLKTGDIVLIKPLAEKITPLITHEIVTLIHEYGDITDPITGKKVVIDQYRDDIDEKNEMYGKLDSTFDYKKAPPRGWQEGKRDFTDKPTFRKWQVFPEDDPYGVY